MRLNRARELKMENEMIHFDTQEVRGFLNLKAKKYSVEASFLSYLIRCALVFIES
jgi:hypothetical protein